MVAGLTRHVLCVYVFAGRGEPDVGLAIHDAGPTKNGAMASAMREVDLDGDGA